MAERGYPELRDAHGCVFRFIEADGLRLTDLAERSGFTKQAVGEVVADLERLGYVERVPDAGDRRAKIIRLTERGRDSRELALQVFDELESEWSAELGEENVAGTRATLESLWELLRRERPL